jgi:hypothetical protein
MATTQAFLKRVGARDCWKLRLHCGLFLGVAFLKASYWIDLISSQAKTLNNGTNGHLLAPVEVDRTMSLADPESNSDNVARRDVKSAIDDRTKPHIL